MAGISHVLSIAKEALLTHQLSVQVASHNIANVDTAGYTRQTLTLTTHEATPIGAGMLGGGVKGDEIIRNYDQFMVERLVDQQSTLGSLEAQQQSMRLVETVFNEAPGLALNDLMNQFWTSWQDLADNPEILATRQSALQSSQLVIDQLQTMSAEMAQAKFDIGVSLDTAIDDVNSIVDQIANLNVQISAAESSIHEANDLRDRRDTLLKDLSELVDISFFEDKTGGYTVLLANGHTLVEGNESWKVDWQNNELIWVNRDDINNTETRKAIGSGSELGGKIGGWLEVRGQLVEGNPDNYLGRLDAFANALIREINQQHTQGVGMFRFSETLTGAEQAKNTSVLTGTVDAATANKSIPAGTIKINDLEVGEISGANAVNGLAMTKAYNAVNAINKVESDVTAKLTTLVAGAAVTDPDDVGNLGETISFDINGVSVNYTIQAGDSTPATFAANLRDTINAALTTYNGLSTTANPITIEAVVGDGANGGAANAIILQNTNTGDESNIIIENLTGSVAGLATATGLTEGTYNADASHNTGEITLFSTTNYTVTAGNDDATLQQLGLTLVHANDQASDGTFDYGPDIAHQGALLQGYDYADQLSTDTGTFDIWIYNTDGTLAVANAVTVSLERAYSLSNVTDAINVAISNATGGNMWVQAEIYQNSLRLTPDGSHEFAFADDSSNFLQAAGLNTFFTGDSAASIGINSVVENDLNMLAAAQVGDNGEIFRGDNSNALEISNLQHEEYVYFTGGSTSSLDAFYNALVGEVANEARTVNRSVEFNQLVNNQMSEMRDSVSGVSLDEEMANLVKYQHAYTAAARLITMSDEMLLTLLDSV